ncbi:uncharacterized protein LOC135385240 [Ornithodoros turicata]|uniref:uncharacterized protein LOC135385240 n=1 Tax=Ornithodoros turicata TaxID=34597 RepID=UPI00313A0B97
MVNHAPQCKCFPPFESGTGEGTCVLKRFYYTVKFKVVRQRIPRSAEECPESDQARNLVVQLYPGAEVDSLECLNGEYTIHFKSKTKLEGDASDSLRKNCRQSEGGRCVLPGNLIVETDSIEVAKENLCNRILKEYIKHLNQNHKCQQVDGRYVLKCADELSSVGAETVFIQEDSLTVHLCSAKTAPYVPTSPSPGTRTTVATAKTSHDLWTPPSPGKPTTVTTGKTGQGGMTPTTAGKPTAVTTTGPKCSDEDVEICGAPCVLEDGNPICQCRDNQRDAGYFGCSDVCSRKGLKDCVLGRCFIEHHIERCKCDPPFELDTKRRCGLKDIFYILKFKVDRGVRSRRSADLCPESDQVKQSMKQVYPHVKNVEILDCPNGEYKIRLVFDKIPDEAKITRDCKGVQGNHEQCLLPGNLRVQKSSLEFTDENLCDSILRGYIRDLNQNHVCQKRGSDYILKCPDKFRPVNEDRFPIQPNSLLNVYYCSAETCNSNTCPGHSRACVDGQCVCKKGFVQQGNDCIDPCSNNPCKNGGTCKPHPDVNFLCLCPAKFKGLKCEEDNLELRGAKLNVVIVGVVMAVLLLLALIVSASVISRMKKKQGLLDDTSKELGVQSRHAYEGPYNASAPVYNHDNTTL